MARLRSCRVAGLAVLFGLAAGCGPSGPKLKPVYPVHGSVYFQGQPAAGAVVMFHPLPLGDRKRPSLPSRGTVGPDGDFRLTTYNMDDGAPEGDYAVAIYWPGKRAGKRGEDADSDDLPPDRLGLKYNDPARSPLKATVSAPTTRLDRFDLR